MDITSLRNKKQVYDDAYYNTGKPLCSDREYDELVERIAEYSDNNDVGAIPRQNAIKLPYWMGSLDKVKTQDSINRWIGDDDYKQFVITPKLDGVSCLLVFDGNNNSYKLYTRGNGMIGSDITPLSKYIRDIHLLVSIVHTHRYINAVRGELVVKKSVFVNKYSGKYSNPRNLVSGIVNSIHASEDIVSDINFVPYEIISNSVQLVPSKQLQILDGIGVVFTTVDKLQVDSLSMLLSKSKHTCDYEIDGLVIQPDEYYTRNTNKNPKYMKAFKGLNESVKTVVEFVEWNVSKQGILKPRVKINKTQLSGVSISYVTGFNAKFIETNNIGKGTVLLVSRSGDVIPHIEKVVKPTVADLPSACKYHWDDNHVDIYLVDNSGVQPIISNVDKLPVEQAVKLIDYFFKTIGVKNVGSETIRKLYNTGLNSIKKIYNASVDDFKKIDGFKDKMASKLYKSIHSVVPSEVDLLTAFNIPNLGSGKVTLLLKCIPDFIEIAKKNPTLDGIQPPKGIPIETLKHISSYIPAYTEFIKECF